MTVQITINYTDGTDKEYRADHVTALQELVEYLLAPPEVSSITLVIVRG